MDSTKQTLLPTSNGIQHPLDRLATTGHRRRCSLSKLVVFIVITLAISNVVYFFGPEPKRVYEYAKDRADGVGEWWKDSVYRRPIEAEIESEPMSKEPGEEGLFDAIETTQPVGAGAGAGASATGTGATVVSQPPNNSQKTSFKPRPTGTMKKPTITNASNRPSKSDVANAESDAELAAEADLLDSRPIDWDKEDTDVPVDGAAVDPENIDDPDATFTGDYLPGKDPLLGAGPANGGLWAGRPDRKGKTSGPGSKGNLNEDEDGPINW